MSVQLPKLVTGIPSAAFDVAKKAIARLEQSHPAAAAALKQAIETRDLSALAAAWNKAGGTVDRDAHAETVKAAAQACSVSYESPVAPTREISPAQAAQEIRDIGISTGGVFGQVDPSQFTSVRVETEYNRSKPASVGPDGKFHLIHTMGMNRPVKIIFSGPGGELEVQTKSGRYQGYSQIEGQSIRDDAGNRHPGGAPHGPTSTADEVVAAKFFRRDPVPETTKLSPAEAAAQFISEIGISSGGAIGHVKPGQFTSVRVKTDYDQSKEMPVNADGSFFALHTLGIRRPVTLVFSGPAGELEVKTKSGSYQGYSQIEGQSIRTENGKLLPGRKPLGPTSTADEVVPAEFVLTR